MQYLCDKASKCKYAEQRRPTVYPRLLIDRVVRLTRLYAVLFWGKDLHILVKTRKLSVVYRRTALRMFSALRTISDEAAFVISIMKPTNVFTNEITNIYKAKLISSLSQAKKMPEERDL